MTQLIYKTETEEAVRLVTEFRDGQLAARTAWDEFSRNLSAAYPVHQDGPLRRLAIVLGLVVGFYAAFPGEQPPNGWAVSPQLGCFIPDVATSTGKRYQQRLDDLPGMPTSFNLDDIGMPHLVEIAFPDGSQTATTPTMTLADEGGIVFILWEVREAKPAIDAAIKMMDRGTVWVEVPRSVWYARLEAWEEKHAAEHPEHGHVF